MSFVWEKNRSDWSGLEKKYFRHAHFKGGKGSTQTQSRTIPNQTANEASLEKGLMNYNLTGLNSASGILNQGVNSIGNTYNPDWSTMAGNYNNAATNYNNTATNNLKSYQNSSNNALGTYTTASNQYLNDYQNTMQGINSGYSSLANGELPSAFAANRQNALNSDLTATVGNKINTLGNRGVLNSSVTNQALNDISQDASNTLAKNYSSDLQTESGLLGASANNASTYYGNRMNNANSLYNNQTGSANNIYGNQMSNASSQYGTAKDALSANSQAQSSSYTQPTSLLGYASQLSTPSQNMFNTMYSGRMGTAGVNQTSNDGGAGLWSGMAQLGSAAIGKGKV